ncbi:MAG: FTR1 family protein [Halothiobacillaceae bacterium]|nr:FTR1 family protein [Halothiobacillaceae bacterium]HER34981.1 iron permease [Halothiobacillaceae bacterium]
MFSTAIIVFREVLEASLVVAVVLAATQGLAGRNRWIIGGIAAGLLGSFVVAGLTQEISMAFEGVGQELFNAMILLTAVGMLAWHNIWMSRHASQLVAHLKQVGSHVSSGQLPIYFLATAVGLAVLREGSEVVLFTQGIAAGGSESLSLLWGGAIGLGAGLVLGALIYVGLVRIPTRHLFTVTGWLILLLAAGMAASAAGFLAQAGWLPVQRPLWNSSDLLSQHSVFGEVLHVLVGYQDRPTAIQIGFYLATLVAIGVGMFLSRQPSPAANR